ncbi:MAG: hypothetical protein ACAH80_08410 [Alphaproteobacteria bacterium]
MKLSAIFNQPDRSEQLDHLEEALQALKAQRRHMVEGNDQIFKTASVLSMLKLNLARAEAYNRGALPNSAGSDCVATQVKKLHDQKVEMARNVVADERKFAAAITAAFGDPKQAETKFPENPTAKVVNPRIIDQQISQINALIDNGSFGNTVKRVAWQAVNTFTRN